MPLGLYLPSYKATGCLAHLGNPTRTAVRNQFPRLHSDGGAELVAQYPPSSHLGKHEDRSTYFQKDTCHGPV